MNAGQSEQPSVYELADEYLERCRTGKRPQLSEYTDKYPALTEEIREIFPMMLLMEDNAPVSDPGTEHELNLDQLGDFRIVREIGRGGMGVVYEAVQESLNRQVALKVCPMSSRLSSRNRERFRRESRAAAMLHHTNIVPVFAVGEDEGNLFYAMQYIRGATLDDVITELRLIWQHSPTVNTNLSNVRVRRSATGDQQASEVAQSLAGVSQPVLGASEPQGKTTLQAQDKGVAGVGVRHERNPGNGTGPDQSTTTTENVHSGVSFAGSVQPRPPGVHESAEIALPGASTADSHSSAFQYWDSVARAGVQVADALDYAHGMGTLHRDIKPANLMLDATGAVWVMDFGLAKSMEEDNLTQTGELIGTMRYMSPEQCVGEPDQRSDIYSLGLTLYEMLALRPAFEELNRSKLLRAIAETDPITPRKLNPQIPRDLETIVLKSIDREPSRRYQTSRELHDDLARFLQREPIHARPISATERIGKWVRRRPMVAALTAALAAMFCVSFALVTWNWLDARDARDEAVANAGKATRLATSEKAAREETEDTLYRSAISRVHQASQTDMAQSRRILANFKSSSAHHWEWGYLDQLVHQEQATLQAGSDTAPWIWALAFSRDEKFLAVGAGRTLFPGGWQANGRATIWDVQSGQLVRELPIANDVQLAGDKNRGGVAPYSFAFSPDGSQLAVSECTQRTDKESFFAQHRLGIWQVHGQQQSPLFELAQPLPASPVNRVSDLRFTPDGTHIIGTVWLTKRTTPFASAVWRVTDEQRGDLVALWKGDELLSLKEDEAIVARYTDASQQSQIVRGVLDLDSPNVLKEEQVLYSPSVSRGRYQRFGIFNVGATGDGAGKGWVATRIWADAQYQLSLQDLNTGGTHRLWGDDRHKVRTRHYYRPVSDFHPNAPMPGSDSTAALLASGSEDGTVRIWDTSKRVHERTLAGHSINVQSMAFSSSGNLLASGDWRGEVRVWSPAKQTHILDTVLSGPNATSSTVEAIAFTEDGSRIHGCMSGANFGSDHLVTIDYRLGQETRVIVPRSRFVTRARDAAFDERGRVLVVLAEKTESLIHVVDTRTGHSQNCQLDLNTPVRELAVSGKGNRFAAAASASERTGLTSESKCWISVHDTQMPTPGTPLWTDPTPGRCVTALNLNREGTSLAIGALSSEGNTELTVIDIETGKRLRLPGLDEFVSAVEFSPTGSRLAAVTESGPGAIFDCETGELLARFSSPGGVEDLAWNPDGTRLAGANRDVITLWDSKGRDLITLKSDPRTGDVQWDPRVLFSPDGKLIAATQWNDKVRVWKSR